MSFFFRLSKLLARYTWNVCWSFWIFQFKKKKHADTPHTNQIMIVHSRTAAHEHVCKRFRSLDRLWLASSIRRYNRTKNLIAPKTLISAVCLFSFCFVFFRFQLKQFDLPFLSGLPVVFRFFLLFKSQCAQTLFSFRFKKTFVHCVSVLILSFYNCFRFSNCCRQNVSFVHRFVHDSDNTFFICPSCRQEFLHFSSFFAVEFRSNTLT